MNTIDNINRRNSEEKDKKKKNARIGIRFLSYTRTHTVNARFTRCSENQKVKTYSNDKTFKLFINNNIIRIRVKRLTSANYDHYGRQACNEHSNTVDGVKYSRSFHILLVYNRNGFEVYPTLATKRFIIIITKPFVLSERAGITAFKALFEKFQSTLFDCF